MLLCSAQAQRRAFRVAAARLPPTQAPTLADPRSGVGRTLPAKLWLGSDRALAEKRQQGRPPGHVRARGGVTAVWVTSLKSRYRVLTY